jgi:hypothetical protein
MSDSYARVLREIVGEPVVTGELWDTVTSVGEGDAGAYAEAIAAITRACGVASVDGALRDESTPGAVLDVMVDRFERYSGFFKPIAAHPNITPRVEEYCLSKRRVALNESLAASAGVSAEAVEKLLRSKSRGVIGALLGNSSLSEEQLRRAEWRARSIGTPMWLMARDACKNRAMPVDVVLSWLSDEREELKARAYALKSPVVPRSVLWGWLTKEACCDAESSVAMSIFDECSNADGDMIDWFLSRWEKQARDELHRATRRRWVAEAALSHPRARATTLERLYVRYGAVSWWLRSTVEKAPSCLDWVRQDAARRLAREDGVTAMRTGYPSASPESVRALYECGYLTVVAGCENAPGDLLAEVLRAKLRKAVEAKGDGSNSAPRFTANDVIVPLSHDNMPVDVRRECARWLPEVLWAVARDGFLGRA